VSEKPHAKIQTSCRVVSRGRCDVEQLFDMNVDPQAKKIAERPGERD
jgi:hypothetical protein